MTATAAVIIDYQNIHLTAHDCFAPPGTPKHETLIHPLLFAEQVMERRRAALAPQWMARVHTTKSSRGNHLGHSPRCQGFRPVS